MNVYQFDYPVRLDDLDYMGIVGSFYLAHLS